MTPLAPRRVQDEQRAYLKDAQVEIPLGGYATLTVGYLAALAAAGVALHRTGRPLPERFGVSDVALVGVATYKLSRLVTREKVTAWARAPFTRFEEPAHAGEVNEQARGTGLRRAVGELLTCPFCASQWSATVLMVTWLANPRLGRVIVGTLSAVTLSDLVQYAVTAVDQTVES